MKREEELQYRKEPDNEMSKEEGERQRRRKEERANNKPERGRSHLRRRESKESGEVSKLRGWEIS